MKLLVFSSLLESVTLFSSFVTKSTFLSACDCSKKIGKGSMICAFRLLLIQNDEKILI
jgi:hypothetical protein